MQARVPGLRQRALQLQRLCLDQGQPRARRNAGPTGQPCAGAPGPCRGRPGRAAESSCSCGACAGRGAARAGRARDRGDIDVRIAPVPGGTARVGRAAGCPDARRPVCGCGRGVRRCRGQLGRAGLRVAGRHRPAEARPHPLRARRAGGSQGRALSSSVEQAGPAALCVRRPRRASRARACYPVPPRRRQLCSRQSRRPTDLERDGVGLLWLCNGLPAAGLHDCHDSAWRLCTLVLFLGRECCWAGPSLFGLHPTGGSARASLLSGTCGAAGGGSRVPRAAAGEPCPHALRCDCATGDDRGRDYPGRGRPIEGVVWPCFSVLYVCISCRFGADSVRSFRVLC
eukprot:m.117685 g.117685  ORF g.117685 m.117685 type:complete len:342 (-) comp9216_c0_seq3:57-1082(-)